LGLATPAPAIPGHNLANRLGWKRKPSLRIRRFVDDDGRFSRRLSFDEAAIIARVTIEKTAPQRLQAIELQRVVVTAPLTIGASAPPETRARKRSFRRCKCRLVGASDLQRHQIAWPRGLERLGRRDRKRCR